MERALWWAEQAAAAGEVPVGAVLVRDGVVLGEGANQPIGSHDPTAHAEIVALRAAAQQAGNYRLPDTTLYVTVEPCHMCMGAFYLSRVHRIVYGARQPRSGACGSVDNFHEAELFNHRIEVTGGVREVECLSLLQAFFEGLRSGDDRRRDARAG